MEKLQDLSQSELQELLDNAERVEAMALESDEIQNIQLEREMALAANRSLAEQNLDRKPYLESQKEALVSRYLQLEAVQQKYREHCSQRDLECYFIPDSFDCSLASSSEWSRDVAVTRHVTATTRDHSEEDASEQSKLSDGMAGQVSPEALFNRLQVESSKTEEESESLADEFLEGSLALDSFLDGFLSLRSLAHKRRVRIEKLQEVLRQRTSASSTATDKPDPAPSSTAHPTTSNNLPLPKQPAPPPGPPSGLPYSPYPVSPPNPAPVPVAVAAASGPSNPPAQFPPYPSAGSSFTPAAGYSGGPPRPAFGPIPPPSQPSHSGGACPYPTQPSAFTGPHPGSAFGQYTPSNAPAPYPASYSYGGYSYPAGPAYNNTQSPTGRPMYRPGYGVPQPYS